MLIPEVEEIKQNIVGISLTPRRLARIIRTKLHKTYGATVKATKTKQLDEGQLSISAYFDYSEWDEFENIEIHIIYSNKNKNGIIICDDGWQILQFKLYQALQHELKHREQYEKREGLDPWYKKRLNDKGWYFQDPDEIDSHAHDIALELLFYGYGVDEAQQKLTKYTEINLQESITLFGYMTYFKYDTNNPYLKKLIKRTSKYLEEKRDTFLCPSPLAA